MATGMIEVATGVGIDKLKPKCIAIYKYMGGVDISHQKIYHMSAERCSKRYWKIFINMTWLRLTATSFTRATQTEHSIRIVTTTCALI